MRQERKEKGKLSSSNLPFTTLKLARRCGRAIEASHAPRSPPSAGKNGSPTASCLSLPTMSVSISSTLEKLPSSCMKWQSGGWKKRFITAKSRGGQAPWASWPLIRDALRPIGLRDNSVSRGYLDPCRSGPCHASARPEHSHEGRCAQGNMATPDLISWADKEGKPASGQLEITPGSTLTVGDLQKGAAFAALHHTGDSTATPSYRVPLACGRHDHPHLRCRPALSPCASGRAERGV